jgi:hypothetical protein
MEKAEDSLREGLAATLRELADGGVDNAERMSAELLDVRPEDPAAHLLAATIALRRARYSDASVGLGRVLLFIPSTRRRCW